MDFLRIQWREGKTKKSAPEIFPIFVVGKSKDLMIRGSDFYAIWDESTMTWSTDENKATDMMDERLTVYSNEWREKHPEYEKVNVLYFWNSDSGSIDKWHKYCQKQLKDNYHPLDEKLIFANTKPKREDYSTKRLSYSLAKGSHEAWDELVGTLYSPEERHKIEWAIGSIVTGDSKKLQKFFVFYGSAGTGKSTILGIIRKLFEGYCCTFSAQALCSNSDRFALEPFKDNPLVAVEDDGDLSRIESNTRLNSLVSHEEMVVDQKYASLYSAHFNAMLFIGTNKPVKITDSKSGVIRRLIDIHPTEQKIPLDRYRYLMEQIEFELGAIAWHCQEVYKEDPYYYEDYIPQDMIGATNDFYNFMEEYALEFKKKDSTTLNYAWTQYKAYCQEAQVPYPYAKRVFKEELKSYFKTFKSRGGTVEDRRWNIYEGFRTDKFKHLFEEEEAVEIKDIPDEEAAEKEGFDTWIKLDAPYSLLDHYLKDCPAQYAVPTDTGGDKPENYWSRCKTHLSDLDSSKLHYVRVPGNLIVIDFDIKDPVTGEKSFELNLKEASKWPKTYVELSKSGQGIHLHYIYNGDVNRLSRIYKDDIEVKVFPEDKRSTLRRKLTKCNDIPVAEITSGLPFQEESKVVNFDGLKNEKALRTLIKRNLNKEIHDNTKSSVDFIYKILNDAYASGMSYDVRNMRPDILTFAAKSSHQRPYCIKLVGQMKFCSDDIEEAEKYAEAAQEAMYDSIVFFDVEVFKNLFIVVWMKDGGDPVRMINPSADDISELCKYKLIGFNCRRYDNHILYARMMDYTNEELYKLSQRIINSDDKRNTAFFKEAYNISYTDVYDFAATKQSLKKWEIALDIHHQELGLPWDEPVPEELWTKVADYCVNDVVATAAVFHHLSADFTAREILADISGLGANATTNQHTTKIIFGDDPAPQGQFVYTDLSKMFPGYEYNEFGIDQKRYNPGVKIVSGKSIYMGEDPGEGGYVYSEPGMYENVALLDIASMHPSSIVALNLFGDVYTKRFYDIMQIRLLIKHEKYEEAVKLFDGKLAKYLTNKDQAKALAQALKIAINSVYGLTSAKFDNKFRDPRNVDNIVAKRGALFMITLKNELQKRGYSVVHVKTDSIKIPNATQEVIDFVMEFGKKYGYNFEHEATYEKMCLVNESVYIAKYADGKHKFVLSTGEEIMTEWTATGAQFQIPYVFKTLFSKTPIIFRDVCETKTVSSALYLDFNENLPDAEPLEKELAKCDKALKDIWGPKWEQRIKLYSDIRPDDWEKYGITQEMVDQSNDIMRNRNRLTDEISKGHNYVFIGKAGLFCPMISGAGGGLLMREKDGKYSSATGTKGYRWMESEVVRELHKENDIDRRYYAALVDEAIATISEYGDFEVFAS